MDRRISRRDFLSGVALGAAGLLVGPRRLQAAEAAVGAFRLAHDYYPPALTGLRGSHVGSYEVAHALRSGELKLDAQAARDTGERYDLVVVGGGISGLAAAYYFRQAAGPDARILILDNHDDFGGHAKRNEFTVGDRTLVSFGGTWSIESPGPYSPSAKKLIEGLGIDVTGFAKVVDRRLYRSLGLGPGVFFDRETFGVDRLVPRPNNSGWLGKAADAVAMKRFLAATPLAPAAQADLLRLQQENIDYLPGLSSDEKKARLARMSYHDYLVRVAKCDAGVLPFLQALPHGLYGVGIDAVPAQDAWGLDYPGFGGLDLERTPGPGMNHDAMHGVTGDGGSYFYHFPDGNATVARLLVRELIPQAIPGDGAEDIITSRADYARLDLPGQPARVRLNSTAVHVAHVGDPASAGEVEVSYVKDGKLERVRGGRVVLACWNGVIPYICPELPAPQREALAYGAKVPLVYTNVVLRDWNAFLKLKVSQVEGPGSYYSGVALDMPVSIGAYQCTRSPDQPIVVCLSRTPCSPGLPARDQHRVGRQELLTASFTDMERKTREQLARVLGAGGFDPADDILAITVNRWPHGYAYQYNSLWDPFWLDGGEAPNVIGRKPFGRIAIANADAAAYAYTDGAIDMAQRAVQELLTVKS
ncbi:MAG: FAD-dependent oxidoreductase [Betaproteobacteria bacterium]|nr:FAD-dependent oxidoreductase [Betaproteobacteria bacterium]